MDLTNVDFGPLTAVLGSLTLLLIVDTVLGAASALAGGSFKWEYLYAVGRSKGLVLFQVAILLAAGAVTPFADFDIVGIELDPFSALGISIATPLAASLVASIGDNIGKKDETAPQGVNPPVSPEG